MDNYNGNHRSQTSKKVFSIIRMLLTISVFLGFDQIVKFWASHYLKTQGSIAIIHNVFELTYLENQGSAWGMLQGRILFLITITLIISVFLIYLYSKIPSTKRFLPLRLCFLLILSGAVGNLIDRMVYHHVIDMFYFKLINFPVFNVADIYITVGAAFFIFLFLFKYKEEELSFWSFFQKKGKII